jgi:hypothetical protein
MAFFIIFSLDIESHHYCYLHLSFSFFLLFLFRYLSFVFLACSGASDTNAMVLDVANHIISISLNSQKLKIYQ